MEVIVRGNFYSKVTNKNARLVLFQQTKNLLNGHYLEAPESTFHFNKYGETTRSILKSIFVANQIQERRTEKKKFKSMQLLTTPIKYIMTAIENKVKKRKSFQTLVIWKKKNRNSNKYRKKIPYPNPSCQI